MSVDPTSHSERQNCGEFEFLNLMHPAHLTYVRGLQVNTLDYLFDKLDKCDTDVRDDILGYVSDLIIQPRSREPVTGNVTMGEMRVDDTSYEAFRQKCYELVDTGALPELALPLLIVNATLQYAFFFGDTTTVQDWIAKNQRQIELARAHEEELSAQGVSEHAQADVIALLEQTIRQTPERASKSYEKYVRFCEQVVQPLLEEHPLFVV